jgi:aminoglycoside phosphotransferase (APT) family kinase protein
MLNTQTINTMLAAADLAGSSVTPVGLGHYNDSYYIDSPKGRFVLRIAPTDDIPKLFYEVDMMRSEPAIHKIVRAKTNVPAPAIVHSDFSRKIVDRDFIVLEFLEGQPGYFSDEELDAIESDVYGYPDRAAPTGRSWPEIFFKYAELILKDCLSCGIMEKSEFDWFLNIYEKNRSAVADCPASLLHLDLWSQNILTHNRRITGILDFDRGLYGDAELEFAVLDTYGSSTNGFFRGYGKIRPSDEQAQIRQRLYIVYELIKYAFIRFARNGSRSVGRSFVSKCRNILREIE